MKRIKSQTLTLDGEDNTQLVVRRDTLGEPFREFVAIAIAEKKEWSEAVATVLLTARDVERLIETLSRMLVSQPPPSFHEYRNSKAIEDHRRSKE